MAEIVIDPGRSQINGWNLTTLRVDKPLSFNLRGAVRQVRFERPVFVDQLSWPSPAMHEH